MAEQNMIFELSVSNDGLEYTSSIDDALKFSENEILSLDETIESIKGLKPECDNLDYALAASSGALCGIIDIFLVGKPGESPFGDITDKWFEDRTKDFAKMCGWNPDGEKSLSSAIRCLEKKFKIPYVHSYTAFGYPHSLRKFLRDLGFVKGVNDYKNDI